MPEIIVYAVEGRSPEQKKALIPHSPDDIVICCNLMAIQI